MQTNQSTFLMVQVSQAGRPRALYWGEIVNCTLVQWLTSASAFRTNRQTGNFLALSARMWCCGRRWRGPAGRVRDYRPAGWVRIVGSAGRIRVVGAAGRGWRCRIVRIGGWRRRRVRGIRIRFFRRRALPVVGIPRPGRRIRAVGIVRRIIWIVGVVWRRIAGLLGALRWR